MVLQWCCKRTTHWLLSQLQPTYITSEYTSADWLLKIMWHNREEVSQGWRNCNNKELHKVWSTKYYQCEQNGCFTNSLQIQSLLGCNDVFLGNRYQMFSQGTQSLHLQGSRVPKIINNLELYTLEDGSTTFLWNVRNRWSSVTSQKNGILNHMTVNTSNSQTFHRLVRVCEGVSLRISVIGNAGICYGSTNAGARSNEGKDLASQVSCCKPLIEWIVYEDRCLGHHEKIQYCQIHHKDVRWVLKCLWSVQKTALKNNDITRTCEVMWGRSTK